MKRAIISLPAAFLGSWSLALFVWVMLAPAITQAAPQPHQAPSPLALTWRDTPETTPQATIPWAIPHYTTVSVNISEEFPINPPTTSVTIDFNNASDLTQFQGISFDARYGQPNSVDYSHPSLGVDGDKELSLTVGEALPYAVYDRHYIYFLKTPITNFIQMEIEVYRAPTHTSSASWAGAGIELRSYGPSKLPTGNSTTDANPKVYFSLRRDTAVTSLGYRLATGWRLDSTQRLDQETTGPLRVHEPTAYKPVLLRLNRVGNNFTFAYKYTTTWQTLSTNYSVALANPLYISLFGVAYSTGSALGTPNTEAVFDNLTYVYTPNQQIALPNWTTTLYGSGTSLGATPNTDANGRLVLASNGKAITGIDDNTTNSGYLLFSYKDPVASATEFETSVQVITAPTVEGGMGGLEVRNSLASNSPKLSYGLSREGSTYRLLVFARDENSVITPVISSTVVNLATPMWLKITRTPNSNTFNFYRAQKATVPTSGDWVLYASTDITMTNQIYAGLFNSSNTTNTQQTSYFDNFQMLGAEEADEAISGLFLPNRTAVPNQQLTFTPITATGTNVTYNWNFGDNSSATGDSVNHGYFNVGTYTVTVSAVNNISSATATATVTVSEIPITGLSATNNGPKPPYFPLKSDNIPSMLFTATTTAGSNAAFMWDFGDGTIGTGQTISHRYNNAGNYTVIVTATNSAGVVTATTTAVVIDNAITSIGFNNRPNPVNVDTLMTLAAFALPSSGSAATTNVLYTWTLPNGVVTTTRTFSYLLPPPVSPATSVEHTLSVQACNTAGCKSASTQVTVQITPDVKIQGFSVISNSPVLVGDPVVLTGHVLTGTNVHYQWTFDDGLILTGDTVSRTLGVGTHKINAMAINNTSYPDQDITVVVYGVPQLNLVKSAPEVVKVGEYVKYTLRLTNAGTDTAFRVVVSDTIPTGATYFANSGDIDAGIYDGQVVTWELGDLEANQTATMYLTVDRPTSGIITNSKYGLWTQNRLSQTIALSGTPISTDVAYPPVANPGPNLDVAPGEFVVLDGSGSYDPDKKPMSFYWEQISGQAVTLSGTNTMSPTFVAPAKLGDLIFRLVVTNISKLTDSRTVLARVSYTPIFDIVKQAPTERNIYDLITYTLTITNRGTAPASQVVISDVIPTGAYYIASSGGLDGGELRGNTVFWSVDNLPVKTRVAVTLVLTAEANIINRDYAVNSGQNVSAKGKVSVVTLINLAPIVNPGRNQTVLPNILTTLDGRKTYDPRDLAMTYFWTQVSGPAVTLSDPTSLQPTFITPGSFNELRFRLTVTNTKGLSNFAEVVVKVASWTTVVYQPIELSCSDTLAMVKSKEAVGVTNGNSAIYVGYQRNTNNGSRDPITMKFTNGNLDWCRSDYETTERDGAGYGILWDGNNVLYGVYTADGQGSGADFRGYSGWIDSYVKSAPGAGSGLEVPVIAKIDPLTGNISPTANKADGNATFITALDANLKVNQVVINQLALSNGNLTIEATAWENPRQANRLALSCNGKSPYNYQLTLTANLVQVVSAEALGCKDTVTPPAAVGIAGFTTGFISQTYTFNGSVDPFFVTAPLTYTWFPQPLTGQGTTKVTYSWQQLGQQTLVLTAQNAGGSLSHTHFITITDPLSDVIPLTQVQFTGPMTGLINTPYTFTAMINPANASEPLVYNWSPAPLTGQGRAQVNYMWATGGVQTVSVLVTNLRGEVSATQIITISEPAPIITAPTLITITGPITTRVHQPTFFSATVSPADVTLPLTYTWQPEPTTGQGTSQVSYLWPTTGTTPISLTVSNVAGMSSGSYSLTVEMTPTVNQLPLAYDDKVTTTSNLPVTVTVLTNDSDPDNDSLTVVAVTSPAHGTAAVINGQLIYTPALNYVGTDSFTYTIRDSQQGEDTALVTVFVLQADQQIVVIPIDVTTVVTIPNPGGEVVIEVPGGDKELVLVYTVLTQSSHLPPTGYDFGEQYLLLQAYVEGQLQTNYTFTRPLTMTMSYRDEDITELIETTLYIGYWHEISQTWAIDGIINQPPDTTLNKITAFIYHLTEFALLGELKPKPKEIYLPIILRK